MTNDESSVDVAAMDAAPPVDEGSRAETVAKPTDSPARRRRNTSPRPSRARAVSATPSAEAVGDTSSVSAISSDTSVSEIGAISAPQERVAEKPVRPPNRRAPRKAVQAAPIADSSPLSDPVSDVPAAEIADIGTLPTVAANQSVSSEEVAPLPRPSRRSRSRAKPPIGVSSTPLEEASSSTPLPIEADLVTLLSLPGSGEGGQTPNPNIIVVESAVVETSEAPTTRQSSTRSRRGGARPPRADKATVSPMSNAPVSLSPGPVEEAAKPSDGVESPTAKETTGPTSPRRATASRKKAAAAETPRYGARLVTRRGLVELQINEETVPPVFFFGNVEGQKEVRRVTSEVQRAARVGVHLHSTLVELPCPLPPDDSVYETLDTRIEALLEADPQGYVMPRLVFIPAPGWRKQYPNEVNHYADGTTDDPSIASDRFWQEAEHALTALIAHIQRMTYNERVIGYHLERGEWFHPVDSGYDRSFANREAFRSWLRAKYKNSEAALRAAWYDGQVQFYTAEIPPMPATPRANVTFFDPRRERRWIDFLEFTSEITADRLISLSKTVKQASDNRALVSVCYGYTFEFGHTFSGHLALGRLLAASSIDMIAGPPSYRDRLAGKAGSFPSPVDSVALHGKLWLSEDDTKTHLAIGNESPDDYNPRVENRSGTEHVHLRAMGKALAHQSAIAWMDLWGEGWLDAEDIWNRIGAFTTRYGNALKIRRAWSPEVVVLVEERSLLHIQQGEAFVRRLLQEHRDILQRSGASVGFYLQSDVTARNFPTDAKLYLFLTPYRMPADQRAAIREKLQRNGKTLVWMYSVGVCDERGQPEEGTHDLIGLTLRQQSWNSEVGSHILQMRHPITEHIQNKTLGTQERLNPSFYVDDDSAGVVVVAEYLQTGLPSVAVREFPEWRSIFCGEPILTADLFRGFCRYAGVHLYTTGHEDYVFAGDGWVTVHGVRDGSRSLLLPPGCSLYDLSEGRLLGEGVREYRTFMRARTTRVFYLGTTDAMRKLGLPGVERNRSRRQGPSIVTEAPIVEEIPIEENVLLPKDVAESEAPPRILDVAIDETVAEQPSSNGTEGEDGPARRRRRRRGGRGRGRRNRAGTTPGESGGTPSTGE